jgi:thiamine biosynthesis lipoprotein
MARTDAMAGRMWMWMWIAFSIALCGCTRTPETIELSGPTMGTTYSVKIAQVPRNIDAASVRKTIDDVLALIDEQMSGYRSDSEISRFNQSTSIEWSPVSGELAQVIALALRVSDESRGALDITVAPLVNLWGMGAEGEHAQLPTQSQIDAAREKVGYRHLSARESPPALRKALPALTVDLNAVAPGYAVDLLASRLEHLGLRHFMIDIGGEIRAKGLNADRQAWRIAIEKPLDGEPQPYAIVQLKDIAVTTSGEYRHYYVRDGHRYSHTIDPRTARPVEHALASVVVIAPSAFEADAWATALNVLGETEGFALAQRRQIPALFIVDRGGKLEPLMTAQFPAYLAVPPPDASRGVPELPQKRAKKDD